MALFKKKGIQAIEDRDWFSNLGEENVKLIELNTDRFVDEILKNTPSADRTIIKDSLNILHWAVIRYKLSDK